MASKKEVTVVINGEEFVSQAAKKAEQGLSGFGGALQKFKDKLIPVVDVTKLVEWGVRAMSAAFNAAKEFVWDSIAAYDGYVSGQQRMLAQSKLTGIAVDVLKESARKAREEFGLGIDVANDASITTAKYASRAGDASKQSALLSAALNLGAASGLTAAESMQALEMGLRGQDEGFDKLLGKNPSTIWKEYADANGLAVGKMTDMQKRMAELTAVIDAGNTVGNVYAERMKEGSGQTEAMSNRLQGAKIAFGAAIQPIRVVVVQGLTALLNVIGPLVIALGYLASGLTNMVIAPFKLVQSALGSVMESIGRLSGNKSMEEWGKRQSKAFVEFTEDVAKWLGIEKPATQAVANHGKAHELAAFQITAAADATKKAGKSNMDAADEYYNKASAKLGPPLAKLIGMTQTAIDDLGKSARDQLPIEKAKQFETHMQGIADNAQKVADRIAKLPKPTEDVARSSRETAESIIGVARGALDAASAFGVIDSKALGALNSVLNIGSSLSKIAGGDIFSGVTGLLGGVANIVSVLTSGSAEHRALIAKNTEQLEKIRTEGISLSTKASGATISSARSFLGQFNLADFINKTNPLNGFKGDPMAYFAGELAKFGLRISDLDSIASDLGMTIRDSKGKFDVTMLGQLFSGLGTSGLGTIGQSFTEQLGFFKESQRLTGATGTTKIQDLLSFLKNVGGVSALNGIDASSPESARFGLLELFTKLNNGGVDASSMGRLSGSQFRDVILEIIGSIDGLGTGTGSTGAGASGTVNVPGVGTVSTGGVTETVQDVMKSQTTALSTILTAQTALHTEIAKNTGDTVARLDTVIRLLSDRERANLQVIDEGLEARRRGADAYSGVLPVLV